jgi:CxxC motif-containing protein (DUF1111 family)/mono/diheme cytochrome c family protein
VLEKSGHNEGFEPPSKNKRRRTFAPTQANMARARWRGTDLSIAATLAASALVQACAAGHATTEDASPEGRPPEGAGGGVTTSEPSPSARDAGPPGTKPVATTPTGRPSTEPPPPDNCNGSLPAVFSAICNTCHTASGTPNQRYPDLYKFEGTLADFTGHVRSGSPKGMAAYPADLVSDSDVAAIYRYFTGGSTRDTNVVDLGGVVPLFEPADAVNPAIVFKRDDGVLVTRGAGRVRGRHEGPLDTNQPFMEFGPDYFVARTYGWIVEDFTPLGQSKILVTYLPISMPTAGTNFRAWKDYENGDVFTANMGMTTGASLPKLTVAGTDLGKSYESLLAPYARIQQQETTRNSRSGTPIKAGDLFEFEFGIFNDPGAIQPPGSRTNYYTDTFRYQVGKGGVTADNPDRYSDGKGILGPEEAARQGGDTTNVWAYFMPETQFGQMALNIQHENVQHFVEGRRLFHTDFATGAHSESGNPVFTEQAKKAGPLGTTTSCESCHVHNGSGQTLTGPLGPTSSMAFKLYDAGSLGGQLQPKDGSVSVSNTQTKKLTLGDGTSVTLSKPIFSLTMKSGSPPAFSGRIARKVIGSGLLEAIDERTILARADAKDCNADGISGRPSYVKDPGTGELRVGRFGWKAEKVDVRHQIAEALMDDMGVGTSLFPDAGKVELSNDELSKLVTYMRLVSVPGQRNHGDAQVLAGEQIFKTIGCSNCHATDAVTSANHPFAELRAQSIKPYTDLLLHDLGPELADDSGVAPDDAVTAPPAASEWRTPPLWGTGLLAAINGHTGLLHDGRAASPLEAVLWHGGEAEATKQRVIALAATDRAALMAFVSSL